MSRGYHMSSPASKPRTAAALIWTLFAIGLITLATAGSALAAPPPPVPAAQTYGPPTSGLLAVNPTGHAPAAHLARPAILRYRCANSCAGRFVASATDAQPPAE